MIKIKNYKGFFRILSIAKNEMDCRELSANCLDFLFVTENDATIYPDQIKLTNEVGEVIELNKYNSFDVIEVWENGLVSRKYNDKSDDNYFFITGSCNSNCVMCPSPDFSRKNSKAVPLQELIELARHIPKDTPHLTITGGEPFMIGDCIFTFIEYLKTSFLNTEFLFLTNGRIFSIPKYVKLFNECVPAYSVVAIPIHGSCSKIHDEITRSPGSFNQTKAGITQLLRNNIAVELRLVANKMNIDDFEKIAELIINSFSSVTYVSIIAMEMTGNARLNYKDVWIPYRETFQKIETTILKLLKAGIEVKLYNFPLCTISSSYWSISKQSISYEKIRYSNKCQKCKVKTECGGIFSGTKDLEESELEAII